MKKFAVFIVRTLSNLIDWMVLIALLFCLCLGFYALWDTELVNTAASSAGYTIYKPTEENSESFDELRKINSEVIGWINVYGTQIDYPIVQAEDNEKYLTINAKGEYEASGSIFLNYHNQPDFSDFNSILYGHHMAESRMFGDLDKFTDEEFFDSHQYGSLYANNRTYGLTFFAMILTDAYDSKIYSLNVDKTEYVQYLYSAAEYSRDIEITDSDHIVLLSTCTEEITNGRHILVARIDDTVQENSYEEEVVQQQTSWVDDASSQVQNYSLLSLSILLLLILLLILWIYEKIRRKYYQRKRKLDEKNL